jgi:deoxyribonuclease V
LSPKPVSDYNQNVKVEHLHDWQVSIPQAREIQRVLAAWVSRSGAVTRPRFIAGVDISVKKDSATGNAAVVVLSYPELEVLEIKNAAGPLRLPYVPGLLSFREAPLILAACAVLELVPDLILVDGQGIAHPRRLGLASHLGLFLDVPTIGCAKSRLCGQHEAPGEAPGSYADITDGGETIGVALRTKLRVKPVYVSVGHKLNLESASHWVLKCCRGYRLPEPTRLAHLAAGGSHKLAAGNTVPGAR